MGGRLGVEKKWFIWSNLKALSKIYVQWPIFTIIRPGLKMIPLDLWTIIGYKLFQAFISQKINVIKDFKIVLQWKIVYN